MLKVLWSALCLLVGVVLTLLFIGTFLFSLGIPYGLPAMVKGSDYWYQVWIAYDKLWSAIFNGKHEETISSRLGKSVYHDLKPVFFTRRADKVVVFWLRQVDTDHCKKSIDWTVGQRHPNKQ